MNVGKLRSYLRNAERVLGLVDGKRHGHHRHHGRGHTGGVGAAWATRYCDRSCAV